MKKTIGKERLLLERPDLKEKLTKKENIENYIILYNTYSNLLTQYFIEEYYLKDFDDLLVKKYKDILPPIAEKEMDMYQYLGSNYLTYFYIRNNIYIERLSTEDMKYLFHLYETSDLEMDEEKKKFIEKTYFDIILEDKKKKNSFVLYGPDNGKFLKEENAIIIGVRYDKFKNLEEKEDMYDEYNDRENKLENIMRYYEVFIETKGKTEVPFRVIEYDEYSIRKEDNL